MEVNIFWEMIGYPERIFCVKVFRASQNLPREI